MCPIVEIENTQVQVYGDVLYKWNPQELTEELILSQSKGNDVIRTKDGKKGAISVSPDQYGRVNYSRIHPCFMDPKATLKVQVDKTKSSAPVLGDWIMEIPSD